MYRRGQGVRQNEHQAVLWYERAAALGDKDACFNLANMLFLGQGIPESEDKAIEYYQKAAEQGDADAWFSLGSLLHSKDIHRAVQCFIKAGENKDIESMNILGMIYQYGHAGAIKDNIREARKWYLQAAQQGSHEAQQALQRISRSST